MTTRGGGDTLERKSTVKNIAGDVSVISFPFEIFRVMNTEWNVSKEYMIINYDTNSFIAILYNMYIHMDIVVPITITFNKTQNTIKEAKHKNTFITRAELLHVSAKVTSNW